MDPHANVREQRSLAALLLARLDSGEQPGTVEADAARLAELVLALDEWRRKGGFDPYCPNPMCEEGVVQYGEDTDSRTQCPDCLKAGRHGHQPTTEARR